jgi:hypothetical protein
MTQASGYQRQSIQPTDTISFSYLKGVEKHAVTPPRIQPFRGDDQAGVQSSWVDKINIFWTPAYTGVTVFLKFSRFSTPC